MDSPEQTPAATYVLDRGFRWIGPFLGSLVPFAVWAFFVDDSEPANVTGGILVIALFTFFAV